MPSPRPAGGTRRAVLAERYERNEHTRRFERFVRRRPADAGVWLVTRRARNGLLRHFVQVTAEHASAFQRSFGARQHVIGFFAARHPGTDHVYLRMGTRVYDLILEVGEGGDQAWTINGGGRQRRFREGSNTLSERLLQLTATEFARLDRYVAGLITAVRTGDGYLPRGTGDCISTWTLAPIGARRRTLAEVAGIDVVRYVPAVMDALLEEGNKRVLGAAVYPVRGREFARFERTREGFLRGGVSPAAASAAHDGYPDV